MSNMLKDTMKTAMHEAESVREGTEHTLASALAALVKGVNAVSGVVAMLRSLDRDDGLAWFGLARRRRPLRAVAGFSAGMAVGAGLGLLFAPMSGVEMRRTLLARSGEPKHPSPTAPGAAEPAVEVAKAPAGHASGNGVGSSGIETSKSAKPAGAVNIA